MPTVVGPSKVIKRYHIALHATVYDIAWFICIITASTQWAWLGPVSVGLMMLGLITWQVKVVKQTHGLALFLLIFWGIGLAGDTMLMHLGMIQFPPHAFFGVEWLTRLSPLFMQAIWISFGMAIYATLQILLHRYVLTSLLSLILFPLAYYLGALLNAAILPNFWLNLGVIGITYAVLMPLAFALYQSLRNTHG